MLLPTEAFAHVPELIGMITPPEESRMRMTRAMIGDWDIAVKQIGLPSSWRRSHEEREELRRASMVNRWDRDLWVFAYGGLMWDPAIHAVEIRRARVPGWHRSFSLSVEFGRGTPERPCLQGSLDAGGLCDGLAFRVPAEAVDRETEILCMREMICEGYAARFLPAETPQGAIEVLAFTADTTSHRHVQLSEEQTAEVIATAAGHYGSNLEYLQGIVTKLRQLGISDPATERLWQRCAAIAGAQQPNPTV